MNLIERLLGLFRLTGLWKNIILVSSGTVLAQLISIALTPIVTRLYLPEDYGILTSFNSLIAVLVIGASFDYHKAIPLAKTEKQVLHLLCLSLLILSIIVLLTLATLVLFGEVILHNLNLSSSANFLLFLPLALFFIGAYKIFVEYTLRNRDYKTISQTSIIQSAAANIFRILLGIVNGGWIALIISSIIGKSFGLYKLIQPLFAVERIFVRLNRPGLLEVSRRYRKYPLYSTPSNLIYTLGNNIPMLFILAVFGSLDVGLFGLATNIISIPLSFVGMSVSQVFFAEAAKIGKDRPTELRTMSIELVRKLATIGLIPFFIVVIFGPQMFSLVFGTQWYQAGEYARVLSVMVYFHLLILPVGRIFEILELQKVSLIFNMIRLLSIGLVFSITLGLNLTSIQTITCYVIMNSAYYLFLLMFVLETLRKKSIIRV